MSIVASILRTSYRGAGSKRTYALPPELFLPTARQINAKRSFSVPEGDGHYEKREIAGCEVAVIRRRTERSERAVLFFPGGGMMLAPDKGDAKSLRRLSRAADCDVWFPCLPLCTDHCITEVYDAAYACYAEMIAVYGGGNVSTCGFFSGGALALGIAAHNSAQKSPLPQPRHIVAVSPMDLPWNKASKARMRALNDRDVTIDYAYLETVEVFMRRGRDDIPRYMLSPSLGDWHGVGDIHFFFSEDEILYGARPDLETACRAADVPFTLTSRPGMVQSYCMMTSFPEGRKDFKKLAGLLRA